MELYFKTKINKNGNDRRLCVDLDNKTIKVGYSCSNSADYVIVTLTEIRALRDKFTQNGYKEV
jgi:hypothetical protein